MSRHRVTSIMEWDGNTATLYFEAHVTIDPVFGARRKEAKRIAERWKFAKLLMVRGGPARPSRRDTFMTAHSKRLDELQSRLMRQRRRANRQRDKAA